MSERENNQYMFVSPPRSQGTSVITVANATFNVGQGLVAVAALTSTPQPINLLKLFAPPADARDVAAMPNALGVAPGVTDAFLTLYADGGDVGFVFATSLAVAMGSNAPSLSGSTALGTFDANGIYTPGGAECWRLPTGQMMRFRIQGTTDLFMAFVGTATVPPGAVLRLYQSSPQIC